MKIKLPLYEGDSLIRYPTPPALPDADTAASKLESAGMAALAGPYVSVHDIELRARRMRAEEIARMTKGLISRVFLWLEQRASVARERDMADYLSQSVDHADLERRMRAWEQRSRSDLVTQ